MKRLLLFSFLCVLALSAAAQEENVNKNKFRQMYNELPTPNVYRNAAGAPGHEYWQQRADYNISLELDDEQQRIYGTEEITYFNNSPDNLEYLWVQLDQNMRAKDSDTYKTSPSSMDDRMSSGQLKSLTPTFDGGFKLDYVRDANGKDLSHTVVKTMMRINLPEPLKAGASYTFSIKWWYNINDRMEIGGRSGYEYFEEDDNYLYTIAQFFPRMAVYNDVEGWQNKQFLGRGEFTLPFGNYEVSITVPEDHLVAATGTLQNPNEVLTRAQRKKLEEAKAERDNPVIIVSEEEARENEKEKAAKTKTWKFAAENVRDFAFASSRKFIWDAMGVEQSDGSVVMAMSMYPKEGNPLWEKYSTKAVAHTLKWYSHYTFDYPYPVAWSINAKAIGMEYPMICFNFGRPEEDGTYTERVKYGMIGVIIHEVGHNYFPMIVNSDERQWTWMDEGLNSFLQYLAEQQWERDYPSRRGPAHKIVDYMKGDKSKITPIMTNSESIYQFGNNAYGKPATALNILRETIMGRELFDYAFKTYSNRWMFKHPSPADFFRTMEDASAIDLDWFWRGWFFTTDHVDIALDGVKWYRIDTQEPLAESELSKKMREEEPQYISSIRNAAEIEKTQDEIDPALRDFYTDYDPLSVSILDREEYEKYLSSLSDEERAMLEAGKNYYELSFRNIGGLVMPIIVQFQFEDGSIEDHYIPAEIWRMNDKEVSKVFITEKEVQQIVVDPYLETADTDTGNNYYPPRTQLNRFELYKRRSWGGGENPMQRDRRAKAKEEGTD
ncbi:M1 family metallopeptidase [Phaeodactylibacter luteus]|uniref:M1 family metallopeptidase n=1 Tax=Phaeodactylibacter luteus TaxID=1564516 RepID=A0A5C6RLP4_9BACT|nr:M1 family metallopeptidase [Phaeodactylibacter luteus]TXB62885.1 M1 family metallopeptidase [Phaeodactylibacter luteus]